MLSFTLIIFALLSTEILSVEEYICENQTLNIECPALSVIHIEYASYGRPNSTICSKTNDDKNTNCSAHNVTKIVQQRCDGNNNCTLLVSNQIFGEPCSGIYKYLELNYTCQHNDSFLGPPVTPSCGGANEEYKCVSPCFREYCNSGKTISDRCGNTSYCEYHCVCEDGYLRDQNTGKCFKSENCPPVVKFICENDTLDIDCPLFTSIHINYANYGRHNSSICPKEGLDQNVNCSSKCATAILNERCYADFGNNCTLQVSNQIFGDSCVGTYKYLEINYFCKSDFVTSEPGPQNPAICNASNEEIRCVDHCYGEFCNSQTPILACGLSPCTDRCVCQSGYVRDIKTGICVRKENCPLPGTDTHEVFSKCGAGCQPNCRHKNPACSNICKAGFVCDTGYIRESYTQECIRPSHCPPIFPIY